MDWGGAACPQAPRQRRPLRRHGRRRPPLRSEDHGGPGRAAGERLCRQRGRLTPRDTGSSAQPPPNPNPGYDDKPRHTTHPATIEHGNHPKKRLTTKEDSICSAGAARPPAPRCSRTRTPLRTSLAPPGPGASAVEAISGGRTAPSSNGQWRTSPQQSGEHWSGHWLPGFNFGRRAPSGVGLMQPDYWSSSLGNATARRSITRLFSSEPPCGK